ncbi:redoxin domain-containing protein [Geotoga petraea]|jgi:peroxiredoxin|uniref:Peroxiredoxin n=1 Tax=Geotoga petraea TaxID=28234 RepID=A0A1G6NGJ2_9BACT|nr:redoxin domain-containing protein [Geotoga petraea]TGG87871.1 redoxin domain-containing protein [Geotoga petraea]SDC66942.1 Peroxiredoxin [Geotoga petraea]
MALKVGDKIPDFELKDHKDKLHKISDYRGKKVLLSLHPFAYTPVCKNQMQELDQKYDTFKDLGVVSFGLSIDHQPVKAAWAKDIGIKKLPLLSDFWPHGKVSQDMGLFLDDMGTSARANVLIDEEGKVEWIKTYDLGEQPDFDEIIDYLK